MLAGLTNGWRAASSRRTRNLTVVHHKTRSTLFPRQLLLVGDVMTREVQSVTGDSPLDEAARLLLSIFTACAGGGRGRSPRRRAHPGDLITSGLLPLRLGLLAASDADNVAAVMRGLAERRVAEVMTRPAVTIEADRPLTEAVELMLERQHQRLPVRTGRAASSACSPASTCSPR